VDIEPSRARVLAEVISDLLCGVDVDAAAVDRRDLSEHVVSHLATCRTADLSEQSRPPFDVDLDKDDCGSGGILGGAPPGVPPGVRVRVLLGHRRWLSSIECATIAAQVWSAAEVEVDGSDPGSIRELVDYLRRDQRLHVA